ncbi:MAG: ATP-binding cassette domain-containing protein [Deltaproteobacteria bacterium]|nr:ATP-binding cassette domain-containing protein [Deltaproteobacteria bacterium]
MTPTDRRHLVELERVYKFYRPEVAVLRDASTQVERGEFVYVTGPSGAGKSTLLRMIYRAEVPDHGRILFCGRDVGKLRPSAVPFLRRNIGVVFQDFATKILRSRSVFDNVALALEVLGAPSRVIRTKVTAVLESVGLGGREPEIAGNLSGGEQQRIAIARALVNDPPLLLADEPTGNLDPDLAMDVARLFDEANAGGTTVIFATHDRTILSARPRRTVAIIDGATLEVDPPSASGREMPVALVA